MEYESTRGGARGLSSAAAIWQGMAPDGGLFVPSERVRVGEETLARLTFAGYRERAAAILGLFLTDFTPAEIRACVAAAYTPEKFSSPAVAPVHKVREGLYFLELWHGPTCAFKDMALQLLPHLLTRAARKLGRNEEIVILVATSGDTGKAALEGFRDVPGTRIIVFYPEDGVSEIQRLQMVTQEGKNTAVIAVRGNFDDAQAGVKAIFDDPDFREELRGRGYTLSSANSINWGRLVPQIVYYFSAYLDLCREGEIKRGEPVNFVVPTGNFGNILAAYYARQMGLPVKRLICAANANNVLVDFIRTGVYDRERPFHKTLSPSMDILVSSNLERLLYDVTGRDAARVRSWMAELKAQGRYRVDPATHAAVGEVFWADFADDAATLATIRATFEEFGYVIDTHTAVGRAVYEKYAAGGDRTKTVIAATASPFKFNASVARALCGDGAVTGKSEFELLELLRSVSGMPVPAALRNLERRPVRHRTVVERDGMAGAVRRLLT
ncbi:MAG: threonine synthase [Bacillota bacterium]